ncbi:MAG: V-type ATP synthase subunit I [Tyzzerella sp.]|uniref:V-type ATP synthase subunit I n=1 Tax=Candidatus Fimicola merdigallinarum TaxID=2840819 RepID=A0A9D9DY06_9FIRM|nr:V-type ATP synthase subunit I [Candidatus Fimicola merdigallinarum]
MAIVNMNKISIVGLEADKSRILKFLMKKGFVQISDNSNLKEDESFGNYIESDSNEKAVFDYEQRMSAINVALSTLKSEVKVKKPLLSPKPDFLEIGEDTSARLYEDVLRINGMSKEITDLKAEKNSLETSKELLKPWVKFDLKLSELSTKTTRILMGTIPTSVNMDSLRTSLYESIPESLIGVVYSDKQFNYVFIVVHKDYYDSLTDFLRDYNFSLASFGDFKNTPEEEISIIEKKISDIDKKTGMLLDGIKGYGERIQDLENLYDYYMVLKDENKALENLVKTKKTFCMTGWLPTKKSDYLVKALTENYGCYVETEKGDKEEGFPVLLENSSFVTPFEDIVNMYSTPSTRDIDPSGIMAIFYIIFFGMMLADAGYGILISISCLIAVKKLKLKKGQGNLIKLMGICGISTAFWGFVFGSFFGVGTPALINPLDDVMLLMAMSLIFGLVHIYVGLGIKGYMLLKDKDIVGFISDIVLWYIFITGVCLLVIPVVAGDIGIYAVIGKYLAIVGAIGIILTGGRSFKGIFVKLFKGVTSLYGITGYFGDVLSYTRLMALCLSSGVIGQVINLLGEMAGPVGMVIIGLLGHSVNLFIGALGAYVHTSRLQFVEFFGKFYEGGGEQFTPFKFRTKYTNVNEEEM